LSPCFEIRESTYQLKKLKQITFLTLYFVEYNLKFIRSHTLLKSDDRGIVAERLFGEKELLYEIKEFLLPGSANNTDPIQPGTAWAKKYLYYIRSWTMNGQIIDITSIF
jgi:hypothetical protein